MSKSKVASQKVTSRKPAAKKAASRRNPVPLDSVDELLKDARDDKELKPAYDLASSLLKRGHGTEQFSGRTLKQWNATLRSPSAGINERRVAKAAILGLAAQIVREWLDVELTIRFE